MKLILASASPRRKELIKSIPFLDVECVPSHYNENFIKCETPEIYASIQAYGKASDVFRKHGILTLGVDTVVAVNDRILGKPSSRDNAIQMLKLLSDTTHKVISGFCLHFSDKIIVDYEKTEVTFGVLTDDFIAKYIDCGSCFDKAGAYGIQDDMIQDIVLKISGDYNNVVGLPVKRIEKILMENVRNGSN